MITWAAAMSESLWEAGCAALDMRWVSQSQNNPRYHWAADRLGGRHRVRIEGGVAQHYCPPAGPRSFDEPRSDRGVCEYFGPEVPFGS